MRELLGNTQLLWPQGIVCRLLLWDKLITMITEVEAIINTCPLTYVYGDFYQVLH